MVVAKVLGPIADEESQALLEREFELARRLDHPAIVRVLGFARDGDHAWLTRQRMPGGDARRLRGGSPLDVVRAILPVVDALEHAHARGVVHGDLKASSVLLDREGRGRLADFSVAAALPDGDEPPDPADDVYGLGALLYDLLAGQPPIGPDFRSLAPVPRDLADLVASMLAKRKGDRPRLSAVRAALLESTATSSAPPRSRREVALQPPPRVGAIASSSPFHTRAPGFAAPAHPNRGMPASALALYGSLAVAALGVFVLLPRWVAKREGPRAVETTRSAEPTPTQQPPPPSTAAHAPRASSPSVTPPPPRTPASASPSASETLVAEAPGGEWTREMTEGHRALDRGAFAEARAAFSRAEAARPGTPSAAEGLARADEGLKGAALSLHKARGEAAEAREDWRAALVEYDAALELEPQVAFAVGGRSRSLRRAELEEKLVAYLKRPDRLSAEPVAREADQALDQARDATPSGPRLQEQIASLDRLLAEARTPIEVRLQSDGLTDVTVQRVGALGAFAEKSLTLRPGSYVVVGKRRGYRDARKALVVRPGQSPPPLLIRCEEAL
jgi:hypothetical protein